MTIGFLRPVGAAADVAELEYISALHQTDMPHLRMDGSIKDIDIVRFLSSRYGIKVTEEEVRKTVMHGLGGGDDDEVCIDLMELVAILLIPTLIKAANAVADQQSSADRGPDDDGSESENGVGSANALGSGLDGFDTEEGGGGGTAQSNVAEKGTENDLGSAKRQPVKPHPDLLRYVLQVILHDVTGSSEPRALTRQLLSDIFLSYGESELAEDNELLDSMVIAAGGEAGDESTLLDVNAFAHALTDDVRLYDINNEVRRTTNYFDVFKTHQSSHKIDIQPDLELNLGDTADVTDNDITNTQRAEVRSVKKKWTASSIDMAAGTFRSKQLVVILWVLMVVSYMAYFLDDTDNFAAECPDWEGENGDRGVAFACQVAVSVVRWIVIFLSAGLYGLGLIGLGSLGNAIERQGRCALILPWIGIAFILIMTITNYVDEKRDDADVEDYLLYDVTFVLGFAAVAVKVFDFVALCIPRLVLQARPLLAKIFTPTTFVSEMHLKRAASVKMNQLVANAISIQTVNEKESVVDTHYGQALLAFAKLGEQYERVGGYKWTWQQIFSGDLFRKEGVWLSARLLAGNTSMIIVAIWVLISGITLTQRIVYEYDNTDNAAVQDTIDIAIQSIFPEVTIDNETIMATVNNSSSIFSSFLQDSYNCSALLSSSSTGLNGTAEAYEFCFALENGANASAALHYAGLDMKSLETIAYESMYAAAQQAASDFYPSERYMVVAPFTVATIVAFLSALALTTVYVPSVTSTTLQLRSGVIPTFRNPKFDLYRFGADLVTILLGSMFWGSLASSILIGGFFGCVVFFFVWQVTEVYAVRFIAFLVGITIISIIRVIILVYFRGKFFTAFYRMKPARANIGTLFLEAATFGLSVGFIFMRVLKLLLATAMFIGRIDRPFLAPGVGNLWGYFELDAYPTIYQRDILAHEAHRHPLIELLGVMYMMKLRYGESFAKQSGSCWRLILVYALCPWLSKYRILTRKDTGHGDANVADDASLQFMSLRKVIRESMTASRPGEGSILEGIDWEGSRTDDGGDAVGEEVEGGERPTLTTEEENEQLKQEIVDLKRRLKANGMRMARSSLLMGKRQGRQSTHNM